MIDARPSLWFARIPDTGPAWLSAWRSPHDGSWWRRPTLVEGPEPPPTVSQCTRQVGSVGARGQCSGPRPPLASTSGGPSRLVLFVLRGPRFQQVHVQLYFHCGGLVVCRSCLRYDLNNRRRCGRRGDVDARTGGNNVTRPPGRRHDAALFCHLRRRRGRGSLVVDLRGTRVVLVLVLFYSHRPNTLGLERSEDERLLLLGLRRDADRGLFRPDGTVHHEVLMSLRGCTAQDAGVVLDILGRTGHHQGSGG